jgi:hypothetical protein
MEIDVMLPPPDVPGWRFSGPFKLIAEYAEDNQTIPEP